MFEMKSSSICMFSLQHTDQVKPMKHAQMKIKPKLYKSRKEASQVSKKTIQHDHSLTYMYLSKVSTETLFYSL